MSRFAYCHFCDDVRLEVGNKVSLMGIYGGELLTEEIPAIIPKLWIVGYCNTPADQPFKSLFIQVEQDGKLILNNEVPEDELSRMQDALYQRAANFEPLERISIGMNVQLAPVVFEGPSVITVKMISEGNEHLAGKLRLLKLKT